MFFTQDDYNKIYEYIQKRANGVKDSQFPSVDNLSDGDSIAILHNDENSKISVRNLYKGIGKNNIINYNEYVGDYNSKFTLKDVINGIQEANRIPGCVVTFLDTDSKHWETYQFTSSSTDDWYDEEYWRNVQGDDKRAFKGYFPNIELLHGEIPNPYVGDYAFVGDDLGEAIVYICYNDYTWTETTQKAIDCLTVIVDGNITVGKNGNWYQDGKNTGIPARGEKGDTPYFRYNPGNGNIEYSFDRENWTVLIGKDEITGAAATITLGKVEYQKNASPKITNSGNKHDAVFDFVLPDFDEVYTKVDGMSTQLTEMGKRLDEMSKRLDEMSKRLDKMDEDTDSGDNDSSSTSPSDDNGSSSGNKNAQSDAANTNGETSETTTGTSENDVTTDGTQESSTDSSTTSTTTDGETTQSDNGDKTEETSQEASQNNEEES